MIEAYTRAIATATRLIEKYGAAVTWTPAVEVTSDPAEPWNPTENANVPVDYTPKVLFVPPQSKTLNELMYLAGTDIPQGYERGLMAPQQFVPSLKDTVVRDGKTISLIWLRPIKPASDTLLYIFGLQL